MDSVETWRDKIRIGPRVGTWQLIDTAQPQSPLMGTFSEEAGLQRGGESRWTEKRDPEMRKRKTSLNAFLGP